MTILDGVVGFGLFGMIVGVYAYVNACAKDNRKSIEDHKKDVDGTMKDLQEVLTDFRLDITSRLTRIETKIGAPGCHSAQTKSQTD